MWIFFFLMIRRPPRSTLDRSSAASDVYKRQVLDPPVPTDLGRAVGSQNRWDVLVLGEVPRLHAIPQPLQGTGGAAQESLLADVRQPTRDRHAPRAGSPHQPDGAGQIRAAIDGTAAGRERTVRP